VHAIERLRWLAGTQWAPAGELAAEAAWALGELASEEPAAVLPSCRRLLERHPACGPLWWVAATVVGAGDQVEAAGACADALMSDATEDLVDEALASGRRAVRRGSLADVVGAEIVVVAVEALGAHGMVIERGRIGLVEAARQVEVPIWLVAGVGCLLPPRLFSALVDRLSMDGRPRETMIVGSSGHRRGAWEPGGMVADELGGVTDVVGPTGLVPLGRALAGASCPEPPELLGGWRAPG
jgi:hypothetical protein